MLNQPAVIDELARQRAAELHDAVHRGRLAGHAARLPRTRAYAGRVLIALGTRLARTETPATNRQTRLAGR